MIKDKRRPISILASSILRCYRYVVEDTKSIVSISGEGDSLPEYFYMDEAIQKSSIGEYYSDSIIQMFKNIKDMYSILMKTEPPACVHSFVRNFIPFGVLVDCLWEVPFVPPLPLAVNPLSEIQGLCGTASMTVPTIEQIHYKERHDQMVNICQSLCTGFPPQQTLRVLTPVTRDLDHLENYYISLMLYPYVLQPLAQLRLLSSTLEVKSIESIAEIYTRGVPGNQIYLGNALKGSYDFTFDIHSSFPVYQEIQGILESRKDYSIERQMWTPFFKFDMPSEAKGYPDEVKEKGDWIVKRSQKLYVEILKTVGLQYEAQYAALLGHRGRFYISLSLAAAVYLCNSLSSRSSALASIREGIRETINRRVPFMGELWSLPNGYNGDCAEKGDGEHP